MKKLLTFLMFFLLATIAVQVQATEETLALNEGSYYGSGTTGQITWTGTNCYVNQQKGSSSTNVSSSYVSQPRWYQSHKITFAAVSGSGCTLTGATIECTTTAYATALASSTYSTGASATSDGTTVTITASGDFTITMGAQTRITSIVVSYSSGSTTSSIALNATSVDFGTVTKGATVEAKTIAATLSNVSSATATLRGDGASAFTISPTTLSSSGNITITPSTTTAGTYSATLTLSATGATSVTAEITMTVEEPFNGTITTLSAADDADIKFVSGSSSATKAFWVNSTPLTANGLTLSGSDGSSGNYSYYDGSVVRFYKNNTFTITPADGVTIVKIEIIRQTTTGSNTGTIVCDNLTADSGNTTTNTNVFTGSTTSAVTFSNDNQARFTAIRVYITGKLVEAPVFDVATGSYSQAQLVLVDNYNEDYMYFYTLDGTDPDCDEDLDATGTSLAYNKDEGITISQSCTLKMIAVDIDGNKSAVTSATYTIGKLLSSISVSGTPEEFWKGDTFNHNGMTVTAKWSDNTETDVTSESTFSTPDMTTAGEKEVTVTYSGKSVSYEINVKTIANTQETAYTVAEAIALIKAGKDLSTKVYVKGIVSKIVTAWSDTYNNITYNISDDGSTTSDQFQLYRCKTNGAEVGNTVIGYGELYLYVNGSTTTYEFKTGNEIVEISWAPEITPNGGNFESTQDVTITAEDGCTIYYTTDGTTPTTSSTQYTVAFTIDESCTVKAIAVKADGEVSAVASAQFYKFVHVKNIAEFNNLDDHTPAIFDNSVVVLYDYAQKFTTAGHDYIWIKDNSGYTQIYTKSIINSVGESDTTHYAKYENGDVIPAGFKATRLWYEESYGSGKFYEALVNSTEDHESFKEAQYKAPADAELITFDIFNGLVATNQDDIDNWSNRYVLMKNVYFGAIGDNKAGALYQLDENNQVKNTENIVYNKFSNEGSLNKQGTSSVVSVPADGGIQEDGTTKTYNVYGIVQIYDNTKTGGLKWEIIPISFEEYKVASLTLKELVTKGNNGETNTETDYTITNDLQGVALYTDNANNKTILLVKDNNDAVGKVTKADGLESYLIKAESNFAGTNAADVVKNEKAQEEYDQSNWLEIEVPATVTEAAYVDKVIKGGTITGRYTNTVNPRLVLANDAEMTTTGNSEVYYRNPMTPANFMGNSVASTDQKNYFFMTPKPNEYVQVVYAVYKDGFFYLPDANGGNVNEFAAKVAISTYDYNVTTTPNLQNGYAYQFRAIMKNAEASANNAARKAGQFEPQASDTEGTAYVIYPINLQHNNEIVTGVDGVDAVKTVKCVRFYNVAGVAFGEAQPGINIVVTEYTDGSHSTAKVIR